MKTISVGEMMANGAPIAGQVPAGESFEVVNLGRPTVHIVAAAPRRALKWDDHLAAAIPARGRSAEETIGADRDGRF